MSSRTEHNEDDNINELLGDPISKGQKGIYLDCGSHHPFSASPTLLFHENGWNGINIDAQAHYCDMMHQARPNDITLNIAVGSKPGFLTLYLADGLTTAEKKYTSADWPPIQIAMLTLEIICDEFIRDNEIDILKIDLEGWEGEAIKGMNWNKYRPKVICAEAVTPMNNTVETHHEWHPLLEAANYEFVKWDDDHYNRYYIRKEGW